MSAPKSNLETLPRSLQIVLAVAFLALALFPVVATDFYAQMAARMMILGIFAMSLDLLLGVTGLVSLGHAAFFGLAGYALAFLTPAGEPVSLWWTLPAAMAAAALAALVIIEREPARRQRVLALAHCLREELVAMDFNCGPATPPQTPILPILLGDAATALAAQDFLKSRGIWVPAIRPPTVPPGSARLRISLMSTHTDSQIARLLSALRDLRTMLKLPEAAPPS